MKPVKVLLVDDEYLIRWATTHALSDAGYEVTAVEDGLAAMEAALVEHFDFVVTDLDMPGLGGWDLLERLLRLHTPPRVIVTSARVDRDSARRVRERGGLAYVEKSSTFTDGIKEVLNAACAS